MADPDHDTKMEALLARLGESARLLTTSAGWQRWMTIASRFHRYSLNNQLLILAQRPDATCVAGYRAWQRLGRQAKRGERAIAIFAPTTRRVVLDRAVPGRPRPRRRHRCPPTRPGRERPRQPQRHLALQPRNRPRHPTRPALDRLTKLEASAGRTFNCACLLLHDGDAGRWVLLCTQGA